VRVLATRELTAINMRTGRQTASLARFAWHSTLQGALPVTTGDFAGLLTRWADRSTRVGNPALVVARQVFVASFLTGGMSGRQTSGPRRHAATTLLWTHVATGQGHPTLPRTRGLGNSHTALLLNQMGGAAQTRGPLLLHGDLADDFAGFPAELGTIVLAVSKLLGALRQALPRRNVFRACNLHAVTACQHLSNLLHAISARL
jgi:hypothetical protein